jgi:hypothetical protein
VTEHKATHEELCTRVKALERKYETQRLATLEWGENVDTHSRLIDRLWMRVEALEATSKPTPNPSQIRSSTPEPSAAKGSDHIGEVNKMVSGSLLKRVAIAISRCEDSSCWDDEAVNWEPEARAAIREVVAWLKEGEHTWTALKLEQEVDR